MYTLAVNIVQTPIGNQLDASKRSITIDWSGELNEHTGSDENITNMINWLKRYPHTRDIHVYVGQSKLKHSSLKLKKVLQSLGCKVTVRQQFNLTQ